MHCSRSYVCWCFCVILCIIESTGSDDSCASFQTQKEPIVVEEHSTATLSFSVINTCQGAESSLLNINVRQKNKHPPHWRICSLEFFSGICLPSLGCTCDRLSQHFSVESRVEGSQSQKWELVGTLQNNKTFCTEVLIQVKQQSTEVSPAGGISDGVSRSANGFTLISTAEPDTSQSDADDSKSASITPAFGFILLGAILGCVFLMVLVMAIFLVILFKRKGRPLTVPTSPAPHAFRQPPVMDAVMFHAQASGQDQRDSFVSVQGHIYHEISDDSDLSSPAISTVYFESSFSSDDNGNRSDGYLHPTGSASNVATATEKDNRASASTAKEANPDTNRETSVAVEVTAEGPDVETMEPPYENIGNMP